MGGYKVGQILRQIHLGRHIQPTHFHQALPSQPPPQPLNLTSLLSLINALLHLRPYKLLLCVLLFSLTVGLVVSSPFLISYIVKSLLK